MVKSTITVTTKVCPKCNQANYSTTYVGYIGKDKNHVVCKNCGWDGFAYELKDYKYD